MFVSTFDIFELNRTSLHHIYVTLWQQTAGSRAIELCQIYTYSVHIYNMLCCFPDACQCLILHQCNCNMNAFSIFIAKSRMTQSRTIHTTPVVNPLNFQPQYSECISCLNAHTHMLSNSQVIIFKVL